MKKVCIILLLLISISGYAQEKDKSQNYSLTGYLQTLGMVWIQNYNDHWQTMNTITNRLDLKWYPNKYFTTHIGMRNIMNYGMLVSEYQPQFHDWAMQDAGYLNLTYSLANDTSYFIYTNFDRANIEFSKDNFTAILGRQRINWSMNLIWSPNDIFNTFNYFDFDYVERPGCDAVLLQYYTGNTSSVQAAVKINHNNKITAAAMYKFLKWNYDFQFLGGVMEDDMVLGMGWSGQVKGAGFNGEMTYFQEQFVASPGINYTLNKWYFQVSGLYNSAGSLDSASMGNLFSVNQEMNAKTLSTARYSLFGEISFQITPLIKADISSIFNPYDHSFYVGPSLDFSLTQNIGLLLMSQICSGKANSEFGETGKVFYLRLKWSF